MLHSYAGGAYDQYKPALVAELRELVRSFEAKPFKAQSRRNLVVAFA